MAAVRQIVAPVCSCIGDGGFSRNSSPHPDQFQQKDAEHESFVRHKDMGLDAAVYADDDCEVEIASVRIGNVSTVGQLQQSITEKWPSATVLLTKVLYSGSHCGDFLAKEEVQRAKSELEEIRRSHVDDEYLKEFIVGFGGIVDAALEHDRPLTFT